MIENNIIKNYDNIIFFKKFFNSINEMNIEDKKIYLNNEKNNTFEKLIFLLKIKSVSINNEIKKEILSFVKDNLILISNPNKSIEFLKIADISNINFWRNSFNNIKDSKNIVLRDSLVKKIYQFSILGILTLDKIKGSIKNSKNKSISKFIIQAKINLFKKNPKIKDNEKEYNTIISNVLNIQQEKLFNNEDIKILVKDKSITRI